MGFVACLLIGAGAASANVFVVKSTKDPPPGNCGGKCTLREASIAANNHNGPDTATNVVVKDVLPAGVTFISASSTKGSCSNAAGTVTCAIGTLAKSAKAREGRQEEQIENLDCVLLPAWARWARNSANKKTGARECAGDRRRRRTDTRYCH